MVILDLAVSMQAHNDDFLIKQFGLKEIERNYVKVAEILLRRL